MKYLFLLLIGLSAYGEPLTAEKARELAKSTIDDTQKIELHRIENQIAVAAMNSSYKYVFNEPCSDFLRKHFEPMGYKLTEERSVYANAYAGGCGSGCVVYGGGSGSETASCTISWHGKEKDWYK